VAKRPESSLESSSTRSITCSIDILRIHTVVQGFCCDELKFIDKERYWWWLIAAVKLFCLSYSIADERIRAADGQGLVRDYREYETHAARLYSHFPKDKRTASKNLRNTRRELRQVGPSSGKSRPGARRNLFGAFIIKSRSPYLSVQAARPLTALIPRYRPLRVLQHGLLWRASRQNQSHPHRSNMDTESSCTRQWNRGKAARPRIMGMSQALTIALGHRL
jgi:hypothetical protein